MFINNNPLNTSTRLAGISDLAQPYFRSSDTDFARWIKTLKLLGIKYRVERESENASLCLHKKIIITNAFHNASFSHQISVLFKTDNDSPGMATDEFDKFELSDMDRFYQDMPSDMDLVYDILACNNISFADDVSPENLYKVIWVCNGAVNITSQDLYFEFYNTNQDNHKENSLVGIVTDITLKEKLHPQVVTSITDETKSEDISGSWCGIDNNNIDSTIYTEANHLYEPTDYEKWKEFLNSMNIKYIEDENSGGRKSLEIDPNNILSGSYAYIRIVFHEFDDESLGWKKDGFAGFESNDS